MPEEQQSTTVPTTKSDTFSAEIVLDAELGATLHLACVISPIVLNEETRTLSRVASVMTFQTVGDVVQYDLGLSAPVLAAHGKEAIKTPVGFEAGGEYHDFELTLRPEEGLLWKNVKSLDQLVVTTERQD